MRLTTPLRLLRAVFIDVCADAVDDRASLPHQTHVRMCLLYCNITVLCWGSCLVLTHSGVEEIRVRAVVMLGGWRG